VIQHPLQFRWDEERLRAVQWYAAEPKPRRSRRHLSLALLVPRRRERLGCVNC